MRDSYFREWGMGVGKGQRVPMKGSVLRRLSPDKQRDYLRGIDEGREECKKKKPSLEGK